MLKKSGAPTPKFAKSVHSVLRNEGDKEGREIRDSHKL